MHVVIALSTVTTLYMGITGVIANALTIGTLYAFFALRSDFFERVNLLTHSLMQLSALKVHLQRLDDVIGRSRRRASRNRSSSASCARRCVWRT